MPGVTPLPSNKPRINLTLEPELYDLITELAELREVSRSAIVVDMLDAAEPTMRRLLTTLRAFMSAQEQSQQEFLANLEEAERVLSPMVAAALDQLEMPGLEEGEPPHSNTGVTSQPKSPTNRPGTAKKPRKNRALDSDRHGGRDGGRHP